MREKVSTMEELRLESMQECKALRDEVIAKADLRRQHSFVIIKKNSDQFLVETASDGQHRVFERTPPMLFYVMASIRELLPDGTRRYIIYEKCEFRRLEKTFSESELHALKNMAYEMSSSLSRKISDAYAGMLALGRPAEEFSNAIKLALKSGERKFRAKQNRK